MSGLRSRASTGEDPVAGFDFDFWGDSEAVRKEKTAPEPESERTDRGSDAGPSDAVRIAWSAAYTLRAAAVALAVLVVTAVLMTMVVNPDLTLVETVNLYVERVGEFVASLGK